MRRILVDNARRDQREKHGGSAVAVSLDEMPGLAQPVNMDAVDALALDTALRKLEALDPDQARIVELRFFGGLTVEETAEVVGVSPARSSASGHWRKAGCTGSSPKARPPPA